MGAISTILVKSEQRLTASMNWEIQKKINNKSFFHLFVLASTLSVGIPPPPSAAFSFMASPRTVDVGVSE